jgi:ATP-dependent NAD(P)H-hydrate dehydratase
LDSPNAVESIAAWLPRIHALVLGPGLGRDDTIFSKIGPIIELVKAQGIPLVIDADGLFFINNNYHLIHGVKNVILTPNVIEFHRLYQSVFGTSLDMTVPPEPEYVVALAKELGNVTILCKAEYDIMTNGIDLNKCEKMGSPRRYR